MFDEVVQIDPLAKLQMDRKLRQVLNAMLGLAGVMMLTSLVAIIGIAPFGLPFQLGVMSGAALLLIGSGFLFNRIGWGALRIADGHRMINRARSDTQLTIASTVGLFTFLFAVAIEVGAVLFIFAFVETDGLLAFQSTFVLFQMIILLAYLFIIVVREVNASHFRPPQYAVTTSYVLTGIATSFIVAGLLMVFEIIPGIPNLAEPSWQGTHLVTLGVGLEAMAMRTRMRLPSLWHQFREAVTAARVAGEDARNALNRRARSTYVAAIIFVAVSMGLAAMMLIGTIQFDSKAATLSLVIFYGGIGLVTLAVVGLRVVQSTQLEKKEADETVDPLQRLADQKKADPQEVFRRSLYYATGAFAIMFGFAAVLIALELTPFHKKFMTDAALMSLMFAVGPYGWFFNADLRRIEAIDEKFPDLLRDIAESARAGMTLPRALVTAAKGTYGSLTDEVKIMAAQVEWGVAFSEALERFAYRVKTPLIDRTVALVVEASRAGGNVVDILTAASDDAREIKQIINERNEQMKMYSVVVYISFFVFIAVVLILSAQFIPAFKEAVGPAAGQKVGGLQFNDFEVEDFNTLFFHAAVVQAIGGGLVGGILVRGKAAAGMFPIMFMVLAAWVSFRIILTIMTAPEAVAP